MAASADKPIETPRKARKKAGVDKSTASSRAGALATIHKIMIIFASFFSGIFRTAVRNRVIASNPCDDTKLPKVDKPQIQPLPTEVVHRLADAVPDRYRALVILAAGTGMRQGECFGLSVDRINFLRREVRVDRQLVYISRQRPSFGPPKTPKSERTIPTAAGCHRRAGGPPGRISGGT